MVLVCEAPAWTGVPCGRVAPGTPVTVRMTDGGTFRGAVCLGHREQFARQGHQVVP